MGGYPQMVLSKMIMSGDKMKRKILGFLCAFGIIGLYAFSVVYFFKIDIQTSNTITKRIFAICLLILAFYMGKLAGYVQKKIERAK